MIDEDPRLFTAEIILNLMLSYRDIQVCPLPNLAQSICQCIVNITSCWETFVEENFTDQCYPQETILEYVEYLVWHFIFRT